MWFTYMILKHISCIPGWHGPPRSMPWIRSLGRALENGSGFQPRLVGRLVTYRWMATRNPARKPVEVGSLSHHLQGFHGFYTFQGMVGRQDLFQHNAVGNISTGRSKVPGVHKISTDHREHKFSSLGSKGSNKKRIW